MSIVVFDELESVCLPACHLVSCWNGCDVVELSSCCLYSFLVHSWLRLATQSHSSTLFQSNRHPLVLLPVHVELINVPRLLDVAATIFRASVNPQCRRGRDSLLRCKADAKEDKSTVPCAARAGRHPCDPRT